MGLKQYAAAPMAALALGLFLAPTICIAVDAIINTAASLVSPAIGGLAFTSPAMARSDALTKKQSDALDTYNKAVSDFEGVLRERRARIKSNRKTAWFISTKAPNRRKPPGK